VTDLILDLAVVVGHAMGVDALRPRYHVSNCRWRERFQVLEMMKKAKLERRSLGVRGIADAIRRHICFASPCIFIDVASVVNLVMGALKLGVLVPNHCRPVVAGRCAIVCFCFIIRAMALTLPESEPLPSAGRFAECLFSGTRQRQLCREPHSAKLGSR
jgi:hypothetical protein